MTASLRSALVSALDAIRALWLSDPARILLLAPKGADAQALTGGDPRFTVPADPDDWEFADGTFGAVLVLDALEGIEWDRWRLQEVHRVLRPGGTLALRVPSLDLPPSPGGAAFLAGRVVDRLVRSLTGAPRRFPGHRYRAAELEAMVRSLHFELLHWSGDDFRAADPSDRVAVASAFRDKHWLLLGRLPTYAERVRSGTAQEPPLFIAGYERTNRRFIAIRERWCARHPEFASAGSRAVDPASHGAARVLVLAPHADDELVGSAGTLLQLIAAGATVRIIHATDGSAGAALHDAPESVRTTIRLAEAERVGRALGAARLDFWRQDNRAFRVTDENVAMMRAVLAEFRPTIVISPFVADIHPDHFTLNAILERALAPSAPSPGFDPATAEIWYSEIWSLVPANRHCDVTALEEQVERLIRMYTTAMKIDDLPHLCEARYYYNACRLLGRPGFVEAFHAMPLTRHAAAMRAARADQDSDRGSA